MAVQTIILRPTGVNTQRSQNIDSNNQPRFPAETSDENLHLLVNEEIPDDDTTYLKSKVVGSFLYFYFPVELLENIKPLDIRVVARQKVDDINGGTILTLYGTDSEGNSVNGGASILCGNVDVYETHAQSVSNLEILKSSTLKADQFILSWNLGDTTEKAGTVWLTQIYIEVDYDDEAGGGEPEETAVLYLKKSGAWEGISGKVYNKVNGAWVVGTLDDLQADGLVVVQEVV